MNPKKYLNEYISDIAEALKKYVISHVGETGIAISKVSLVLHDNNKWLPLKKPSAFFKRYGAAAGLLCSGEGVKMCLELMDTGSGTFDVSEPTVQAPQPQVTPVSQVHGQSHVTRFTVARGSIITVSTTVLTDEAGTDAAEVSGGQIGDEDADRISGLQDQFHQLRRDCQLLIDRGKLLPPDLKDLVAEYVVAIKAATSHNFNLFSEHSSLPMDTCNTLVKWRKEHALLVDINKTMWAVVKDIARSGLDWQELDTSIGWPALAFELQKGVAFKNRNALYSTVTPDVRDHLKLELSGLNGHELTDRIRGIARLYNVTTTGLGIAIFGGINHLRNSEDLVAQCFKNFDDFLEGSLIRGSISHNYTNKKGRQGENTAIMALGEAGIKPDEYWTEEEQKAQQTGKGTPDVLFKQLTMINGKNVNWIDFKNKLCIPGVSSGESVHNHDQQMEKYVKDHGPGAIIWVKATSQKNGQKHAVGFPESIRQRPYEWNEHVAHFTLIPTSTRGWEERSGADASRSWRADRTEGNTPHEAGLEYYGNRGDIAADNMVSHM